MSKDSHFCLFLSVFDCFGSVFNCLVLFWCFELSVCLSVCYVRRVVHLSVPAISIDRTLACNHELVAYLSRAMSYPCLDTDGIVFFSKFFLFFLSHVMSCRIVSCHVMGFLDGRIGQIFKFLCIYFVSVIFFCFFWPICPSIRSVRLAYGRRASDVCVCHPVGLSVGLSVRSGCRS